MIEIIFYVVFWYVIGVVSTIIGFWYDFTHNDISVTNGEIISVSLALGFLGPITVAIIVCYYFANSPKIKYWLRQKTFEKSNSAQEDKKEI